MVQALNRQKRVLLSADNNLSGNNMVYFDGLFQTALAS
jgi:hypothetical protein